ncbi:MAG: cation:proton antiporter [Bacteriovorax sp.]|jgi:Kef-type K+ transport system membrane component KefB
MQPDSLFFLLLQLFLCLLSIQVFSPVFDKLKAPKVFAEIFAGIILGPTIFKNIFPYFYDIIFVNNKDSLIAFGGMQELGLLLLMFCSGLEVEMLAKGKEKKLSLVAGFLGVLIPFSLALNSTRFFNLESQLGENGTIDSLKYFFAISCSITSIPVISRIFIDLNLIKTKFATICLSVALIEDFILYALMAMFITIGSASTTPSYLHLLGVEKNSIWEIISHTILALVLIVSCFKIFPVIILYLRKSSILKRIFLNYLTLSILILLSVSILSIYFGIPSFLGPFLAGIIIGKTPLQNSDHLEHIKRFSFSTFIPIFFVGIGLKLDLVQAFDFKFFTIFLIFSSIIKISGVILSCLIIKIKRSDAINFGIALNARGGPGIVLASVGLASRFINESYFVTLVLAALITSWFAGFWLNIKRKEIEAL